MTSRAMERAFLLLLLSPRPLEIIRSRGRSAPSSIRIIRIDRPSEQPARSVLQLVLLELSELLVRVFATILDQPRESNCPPFEIRDGVLAFLALRAIVEDADAQIDAGKQEEPSE